MGHRVGSALCPLCHKLEDHPHVLRHCRFSVFMFDTVRKAFGLVHGDGGVIEPSHLVLENPLQSVGTKQGLVLWAGLKAQWSVRCEARFQGEIPSLDDFVAKWVGTLEVWRAEKDLSVSRVYTCGLKEVCFNTGSWLRGCIRRRGRRPR